MHWDTGDDVVDYNLQKLEGFSTWSNDINPEQARQFMIDVSQSRDMLPASVVRHFKLKILATRDVFLRAGDDYLRHRISAVIQALRTGVQSADADPLLKRNGGADFSDRPRSRGEVILDAAKAFEAERTHFKLEQLRNAVRPTHLQHRVRIIEKIMNGNRSYGNREPEAALLTELYRLNAAAEGYYSKKA